MITERAMNSGPYQGKPGRMAGVGALPVAALGVIRQVAGPGKGVVG